MPPLDIFGSLAPTVPNKIGIAITKPSNAKGLRNNGICAK